MNRAEREKTRLRRYVVRPAVVAILTFLLVVYLILVAAGGVVALFILLHVPVLWGLALVGLAPGLILAVALALRAYNRAGTYSSS